MSLRLVLIRQGTGWKGKLVGRGVIRQSLAINTRPRLPEISSKSMKARILEGQGHSVEPFLCDSLMSCKPPTEGPPAPHAPHPVRLPTAPQASPLPRPALFPTGDPRLAHSRAGAAVFGRRFVWQSEMVGVVWSWFRCSCWRLCRQWPGSGRAVSAARGVVSRQRGGRWCGGWLLRDGWRSWGQGSIRMESRTGRHRPVDRGLGAEAVISGRG